MWVLAGSGSVLFIIQLIHRGYSNSTTGYRISPCVALSHRINTKVSDLRFIIYRHVCFKLPLLYFIQHALRYVDQIPFASFTFILPFASFVEYDIVLVFKPFWIWWKWCCLNLSLTLGKQAMNQSQSLLLWHKPHPMISLYLYRLATHTVLVLLSSLT